VPDSNGPKPLSRTTAPSFVWRGDCLGWNFVSAPDLHVIEEWMPTHRYESPHFHKSTRQFYFVLTGEAHVSVNGHHHVLLPGHGIEIPPGTVHQMKTENSEVEFLVISSGPPREDRIDLV